VIGCGVAVLYDYWRPGGKKDIHLRERFLAAMSSSMQRIGSIIT
jgi:hypothetical protein